MTNKKLTAEQQQIIRGMLHIAVLVELSYATKYGAELLVALSKTPFITQVGTLYPLLNRMEKDGLLTSDWQVKSGQTPRRYYRLTKLGKEKLHEYRGFIQEIQTYMGGNKP